MNLWEENYMKKIKISQIIYMAYAVMVAMVLLVAVAGYFIMNRNEDNANELFNAYGATQGDIGMGYAEFQNVKVQLRNVLYLYADSSSDQSAAEENLNTARNNMKTYFDTAREAITYDAALKQLDKAEEYIDLYLKDVDICISDVKSGDIKEARQHLHDYGVDSANKAADAIENLKDMLNKTARAHQQECVAFNRKGNILVGIILLFSILNCIIGGVMLNKLICKPVIELAGVANSIALGEVDHNIVADGGDNEISMLQNSFAAMVDNLKKQEEVLNRISSGDLNVSYTAASDKDAVGKAIVKLINDDNYVFNAIRNATSQISLGSGQIAAASQTLAQGSTEQASAIEQISATITDIANKTKDNAAQASEVSDIVFKAKDDVIAGNECMKEMVDAMKEINESSENIQKIIKVIDDIAFNTNILALNATVEAARAGEQGKGFAVVAEEVRNLAGRSAEASSQTAEMIEDSISKVKKGSELAEQTAKALKVVSDMIEKITKLSSDIAESSNMQASATAQIDQALLQVSQVVQTNSATSEECASASEELSGQARGLEKNLGRFRLKKM